MRSWKHDATMTNDRKMERMMSYHPVTRCTYCSTESTHQPAGDGCHACQRGVMQAEQMRGQPRPIYAAGQLVHQSTD